jgi:hypothetical protein
VGYLLRGATGGARGDIVQEIIAIVRQVAGGLPPEPPNSLDDGCLAARWLRRHEGDRLFAGCHVVPVSPRGSWFHGAVA